MGGRRVVSVLVVVAVAGMAACGPAASPSRVSPGQAGTRATTTVPPGRARRTSLIAASLASAPELHKNTLPPSELCASAAESRIAGSL